MLSDLLRRGEALANERVQAKVANVAAELRSMLGNAAVSIEGLRVVVGGRGVVKRWLTDPALRFLGWGLK
jgi:hypothetical protein